MAQPPLRALIIGSGVAGLSTAIRLSQLSRATSRTLEIKILSCSSALDSNSYWAQGGIIYKGPLGSRDSPELLVRDILEAGAGRSDTSASQKLAHEGPMAVENLLFRAAKTRFESCAKTRAPLRTLEACHSARRIIYQGDYTGKNISTSMVEAIDDLDNVELVTHATALDLVVDSHGNCRGAQVLLLGDDTRVVEFMEAEMTVLATGGVGDLYLNTSNPEVAKGHGLAMAKRAGVKMQNLQYIQFHPTTLYLEDERKRFLLTEALRGEGARLLDGHGRAFAHKYHRLEELAPRDIVARMILSEMDIQAQPHMYLDISHQDAKMLEARFPSVYAECLAHGFDLTRDPIPCVPAAHYSCGGVSVNGEGQTSLPGLYAAGEVACTGLHGANRLASTSLLEGLVWGTSIAESFVQQVVSRAYRPSTGDCLGMQKKKRMKLVPYGKPTWTSEALDEKWHELRTLMWEQVGPVRTRAGLTLAVETLDEMLKEVKSEVEEDAVSQTFFSTPHEELKRLGLENALLSALEIARAAANDPESIGTHYLVQEESVDDDHGPDREQSLARVHEIVESTEWTKTIEMI